MTLGAVLFLPHQEATFSTLHMPVGAHSMHVVKGMEIHLDFQLISSKGLMPQNLGISSTTFFPLTLHKAQELGSLAIQFLVQHSQ